MPSKRKRRGPEVVGFLGVGLDGADAHKRLTQADNFLLVGGSAETHERMQETAIKFNESLQRRGKELREASLDEVLEIYREATAD